MKMKRRTAAVFTKILTVTDKFPYGKYEGKTVKDVLSLDPSYAAWWADTVLDYPLGTKLRTEAHNLKHLHEEASIDEDEDNDFMTNFDDQLC